MNITVNGQEHPLPSEINLQQFLINLGLEPATVVVELNAEVITGEALNSITLHSGDTLEVLRLVGGG